MIPDRFSGPFSVFPGLTPLSLDIVCFRTGGYTVHGLPERGPRASSLTRRCEGVEFTMGPSRGRFIDISFTMRWT